MVSIQDTAFLAPLLFVQAYYGKHVLRLLKTPKVVQASTADNIFEYFYWAIDNFDASTFIHHTQLVLPNSTFFPIKKIMKLIWKKHSANVFCNTLV